MSYSSLVVEVGVDSHCLEIDQLKQNSKKHNKSDKETALKLGDRGATVK